ncbi:hypothetical protein U9M48_009447 [Paspalum notatum var. saurae]|uniref:Uncharacterized protein n=1 Tax=Paspalum notatum var. saurae TaxID=547442 RepID=A0AAQ3SSP6_PASNO
MSFGLLHSIELLIREDYSGDLPRKNNRWEKVKVLPLAQASSIPLISRQPGVRSWTEILFSLVDGSAECAHLSVIM